MVPESGANTAKNVIRPELEVLFEEGAIYPTTTLKTNYQELVYRKQRSFHDFQCGEG